MANAGLMPDDARSVRVSPERLAEFDRLMQEGGIEAVIANLPVDSGENSDINKSR